MPAIRDESWFYSPSFNDGVQRLREGDEKCVRFTGLMLGKETADEDTLPDIFEAVKTTPSKSVCIDWFDVKSTSFSQIERLADDDTTYNLESFHLTMIDLSDQTRLRPVCTLISQNKPISDLILTFCKINDDNIHLLAAALEVNEQILSLNLNFNMLRKNGYLILAESLTRNNTLRYLEAKRNKAEKADLVEFLEILAREENGNRTLEFLDVGQADDIDGKIRKNDVEEVEPVRQATQAVVAKGDLNENEIGTENTAEQTEIPAVATTEEVDLFTRVKDFTEANKRARREREKELKVEQLREILKDEATSLSASLKHCKIMMLGEKNSGKTFFAHCLVHQLFESPNNNAAEPAVRKLKTLSLARVTELGWTKISNFSHVDMVLAKRISTLPVNVANRNKANEVCFQFPDQVVITAKDLMGPSMLAKEDQEMLEQMEIMNREDAESNLPVFTAEEEAALIEKMSNKMDDTIDKALRENNYPSFSMWDVDSPPGFDHIFRFFFNNHGMIFIFFSIEQIKKDPDAVIKSVLKYLTPVDIAKASGKDFTSKIFLIGTFLDQVINDGLDEKLVEHAALFDENCNEEGLDVNSGNGHMDFLIKGLKDEPKKVVVAVKKMLLLFSVNLQKALGGQYPEIVPNDDDNLQFFPLSNNLPNMCETFKHDFDDISGINRFRKKVRDLINNDEIEVIKVMKSLRDAKMIDQIIERASKEPENAFDHSHQYMVQKEFEKMAADAGISSRAEIAILLRYLDVTGIVSWINRSQTLQNVIVLDPNYVIDGLQNFYKALGCSPESAQYIENLKAETKNAGFEADVIAMVEKRVVTHDLLLEKLLSRDNFDYFKDFLKQNFHLNNLNITVLQDLFAKHNFFGEANQSDEFFLVPYFDEQDSESANAALDRQLFSQFRAKFVPANGIFITGAFERTLVSLIDSFNNSVMEAKLRQTQNELNYSKHFIELKFGQDVITLAKLKGTEAMEQNGFLQFEFSSQEAVETFLDFINRVLRKLDGDFIEGCKFDSFVFANGKWMSMDQARAAKVQPYFSTQVKKVADADILAFIDEI